MTQKIKRTPRQNPQLVSTQAPRRTLAGLQRDTKVRPEEEEEEEGTCRKKYDVKKDSVPGKKSRWRRYRTSPLSIACTKIEEATKTDRRSSRTLSLTVAQKHTNIRMLKARDRGLQGVCIYRTPRCM